MLASPPSILNKKVAHRKVSNFLCLAWFSFFHNETSKHDKFVALSFIFANLYVSKQKGLVVNKRVPNYKLEPLMRSFSDFTNYNNTISANTNPADNKYVVWHWSTKVLEYDLNTNKIVFLQTSFISQTTSNLIGKLLRSMPRQSVLDFLPTIESDKDRKRISRMYGVRNVVPELVMIY